MKRTWLRFPDWHVIADIDFLSSHLRATSSEATRVANTPDAPKQHCRPRHILNAVVGSTASAHRHLENRQSLSLLHLWNLGQQRQGILQGTLDPDGQAGRPSLVDRLFEPRRPADILSALSARRPEKANTANSRILELQRSVSDTEDKLERLYKLAREPISAAGQEREFGAQRQRPLSTRIAVLRRRQRPVDTLKSPPLAGKICGYATRPGNRGLNGGGRSQMRTSLGDDFIGNKEKYREFFNFEVIYRVQVTKTAVAQAFLLILC